MGLRRWSVPRICRPASPPEALLKGVHFGQRWERWPRLIRPNLGAAMCSRPPARHAPRQAALCIVELELEQHRCGKRPRQKKREHQARSLLFRSIFDARFHICKLYISPAFFPIQKPNFIQYSPPRHTSPPIKHGGLPGVNRPLARPKGNERRPANLHRASCRGACAEPHLSIEGVPRRAPAIQVSSLARPPWSRAWANPRPETMSRFSFTSLPHKPALPRARAADAQPAPLPIE